jgi:hypothetical protein
LKSRHDTSLISTFVWGLNLLLLLIDSTRHSDCFIFNIETLHFSVGRGKLDGGTAECFMLYDQNTAKVVAGTLKEIARSLDVNRMFIFVFTRFCHWFLSFGKFIQSTCSPSVSSKNYLDYIGFEILTAVSTKYTIF